MRKKTSIKNAILQQLEKLSSGASFAELSRINGFEGEVWYGVPEKNIYYWFSCSKEAIDALNELIHEKKIELRSSARLAYFVDGLIPRYPIARQKRYYAGTRWLPTVIYRGVNFKE